MVGRKSMGQKKNYNSVDVLKLFFSVCVVAIHTDLHLDLPYGDFILSLVFRLAVPFFFAFSGFMLYQKVLADVPYKTAAFAYIKRVLPAYAFFLVISLIFYTGQMWYIEGYGAAEIIPQLIFSVLLHPHGALWYVWASIIAILLLIPFVSRSKPEIGVVLGLLFYGLGLVGDTYSFLILGTGLERMIDAYMSIAGTMRNGLTVGLLFISLGMCCAKYQERLTRRPAAVYAALAVMYAAFFFEVYSTLYMGGRDGLSLYISFIWLIPTLLLAAVITDIKFKWNYKELRAYSVGIYYIHRPISYVLLIITILTGIPMLYWLWFLITIGLAVAACAIAYRFKIPFFYKILR